MSGRDWDLLREDSRVLLARRLPVRFDVAVTTELPGLRLVPLVHMIRQDIWRALRHLRGFAPVVEAQEDPSGTRVTAGGQVVGRIALGPVKDRLRIVLEDVPNRTRWIRCAR